MILSRCRPRKSALGVSVVFGLIFFLSHSAKGGSLRAHRVSGLIGNRVENRDGRELGVLRDFVCNMEKGRLTYAIIASGGWLGFRVTYTPVPLHLISPATAKRDVLAIHIDEVEWDKAPAFKISDLSSLAPGKIRTIDQFYSQITHQPEIRERTPRQSQLLTNDPQTGTSQESSAWQRTSDLIGESIVNKQGKIGEVRDLLVGFDNQNPVLAIVVARSLFRNPRPAYAIPLQALETLSNGKLSVENDASTLEEAPLLTEETWKPGN
jgi:sporulation protein YlmC with PRC-barrel domain